MRLYLVRHAESQGNFEMRLQGTKEFPLTDRGREQASALAERLSDLGIGAVYASPLQRTTQTAGIVAARLALTVVPEPRLQEYDFGETISGLTWDDIRKQHPEIIHALSREDSDFPRYPGEEGRAAFRDRVCEALAEIVQRHTASGGSGVSGRSHVSGGSSARADQPDTGRRGATPAVAIITHAGPIVVYVLETLGRKYKRPIPFAIDNASITTVEIGEQRAFAHAVVTGINDTCHVRESLHKHARAAEDLGPKGR